MPLSGGYDSRIILYFLKNCKGLKTITWGTKASQTIAESDSSISKKLADYFNFDNKFYELELKLNDIEKIFEKFISFGEGRIDHISGYTLFG